MNYIYSLEDPREPGVIRYVGKTSSSLPRRLKGHMSDLKRVNHRTNWIKSLLADGVTPIIKPIIQWDDPEICWQTMEILFIQLMKDAGHPLTNFCKGGNGTVPGHGAGRTLSPETRRKIGQANAISLLGKKHTPEARAKMSASQRLRTDNRWEKMVATNVGRVFSEEHRKNLSVAHLNSDYVASPETREKLAEAHRGKPKKPEAIAKTAAANRGRKNSAESRAAMSASRKGRTLSPEHRAAISARMKGVKKSPEAIAKTAEANRGRKNTSEVLQRMSEIHKARHAARGSILNTGRD